MVEKTHQRIINVLGNFRKLACSLVLLSVFLNCGTAAAISLVSDEETEIFLHQTLRPVFDAAGVTFHPGQIYIVNDPTLNAFVSDGNRMFVNIGTIISADSQNELTGVLAHETGHIQGGHILRHKIKSREIQNISLASMVVGSLAGIAAGRADLSIAAILGSQSSAINSMLTYQISEERSADEAAVALLKKINQSPAGMLEFMKKIQKKNRMEGISERDYYRTHPLTDERISFLEKASRESKAPRQGPQEKEFRRIKAKLFAYTEEPRQTFLKYPAGDRSVPARYAQAIAYFKQLKMKEASAKIDGLINDEPQNPYFWELKGQMLLETGKIDAAVSAYRQALKRQPASSLFKINLSQAMLENNPGPAELKEIIRMLNQVLIYNRENYAWLLLARAYGLQNDIANSSYAAAEFSLLGNDAAMAKRQAENALRHNPAPALKLKIDDLLLRIKQIEKENRNPDN